MILATLRFCLVIKAYCVISIKSQVSGKRKNIKNKIYDEYDYKY